MLLTKPDIHSNANGNNTGNSLVYRLHSIFLQHGLTPYIRFIAIIGQICYVKQYTHYLSNHSLGYYFFLMTISGALNSLIFVPLDYYQQSKLHSFRENNISLTCFVRFNMHIIKWILFIAGLSATVCYIIHLYNCTYVIITCALFAIFTYIANTLRNLLNNLDYKKLVAVLFALETLLKIVLFAIFVTITKASPLILMASNAIALFIVISIIVYWCKRLNVFHEGDSYQIKSIDVWQFGYPISVSAIANYFQTQGYRLLLVPLGYAPLVGIYVAVSNIGVTGMNAAGVIFGQLYNPMLYSSKGAYTRNYLKNASVLVFTIALFSVVAGYPLIEIVTRHDLSKYNYLVVLGVIVEAGNLFLGCLAIHMSIHQKTKGIMYSGAIALCIVAAVVGIALWTNRLNVYTIGISLALSQIVQVMFALFYCKANGILKV